MKTHCRCRNCRSRKKLNKHPLEYRVQPGCQCGARDWIKDEYRHRVELPQMRRKAGRYVVCYADCFHHPHRMGSTGCKFGSSGEYR
jgi:hypothetical protein